MKVTSLGFLLLLLSSVAAEQSWFRKRVAGLGGSLQRYLDGDTTKCEAVTVNFDTDADGTALAPPLCVDKQWEELGLTFFAEGGAGKLPCLFDTANPGSEEKGGDADLGAPNEGCSPSGPGIGEGGAPGEPGENCEPLGNVLIIQEKGVDVPDDNVDGGILTLDFPNPGGQYVYEIGLLDIDYATSVVIVYEKEEGSEELDEYELTVPILGDNSKQTLEINQERVRWIKVMFSRSGAVTYIKFCPLEAPPTTPEATATTIEGTTTAGGGEETTSAGEPTSAPVDTPSGEATVVPTQSEPTGAPVDTPTGGVTTAPSQSASTPLPPVDSPGGEPTGPPVESPGGEPTGPPVESPGGEPTGPPVDSPGGENSCPDGTGCDICPGGTIADDSKNVTIDLPGEGGQETATCAEWFAVGCGLVELDSCSEYQTLLSECCSGAPAEDPTTAPIVPPSSAPVEDPTSAPIAPPSSAPVEDPTSAPIAPPSSAPVEDPTSAPIAPPSSAPVEDPTSAPIAPPTSTPAVEDPTSAPIIPPTSPPVEDPTGAPILGGTPSSAPAGICPTSTCCMEDCCGAGTKWNADLEYCMADPKSSGFDGTYSNPDFDGGCVERTCCEGDCCYPGTKYDSGLGCCIPV